MTTAEKEMKEIVFKHLNPKKYVLFMFGSRATNEAQKWSDYDLGLIGHEKVPAHALTKIQADLEESDLPFKVDVVDFQAVEPEFKKVALEKIEIWHQPQDLDVKELL